MGFFFGGGGAPNPHLTLLFILDTDTTGIPLEQNDSATMSTQSDSENVEQTELNLRTQEMADIVVAFSTVSRKLVAVYTGI